MQMMLLFACVWVAEPPTPEQPDVKAFQKVYELAASNRDREALAILNGLIEESPKVSEYYRLRGKILCLDDPEQSIRDLTKAIELKDLYPAVYYERGGVRWNRKRWNEAVADMTEALRCSQRRTTPEATRLTPGELALVYFIRGACFFEMKQFAKALDDLNESQRLDASTKPNQGLTRDQRVSLLTYRGFVHRARNDNAKALADLNHAIEISPNDGRAYTARGGIYILIGELDKGEKDIRVASQLCPKDDEIWDMLAYAKSKKRDWQGGLACVRRAREINPASAKYPVEIAAVLATEGKLTAALAEIDSYRKKFPDVLMPEIWRIALLFHHERPWEGLLGVLNATPLLLRPTAVIRLVSDLYAIKDLTLLPNPAHQ